MTSKQDLARMGFDQAFDRLRLASGDADAQDIEVTNALQHIYRLGEIRKGQWRLGNPGLNSKVGVTAPGVLGLLWVRQFDTHDAVRVGSLEDVLSDYLDETVGSLTWRDAASIEQAAAPKPGRYNSIYVDRKLDYSAHLAARPVKDTLRAAFDALDTMT